jgi:hypothetical protein
MTYSTTLELCTWLQKQIDYEMYYTWKIVNQHKLNLVDYNMETIHNCIRKAHKILDMLNEIGIPLETFLTYYELKKK